MIHDCDLLPTFPAFNAGGTNLGDMKERVGKRKEYSVQRQDQRQRRRLYSLRRKTFGFEALSMRTNRTEASCSLLPSNEPTSCQ
jgi:hypothetical protein